MTKGHLTFLCTADLHLGRVPTRLPEDSEPPAFSTRKTWERIADRAIDREVDFLLMAGDIVDAEHHFYEALGALESGLLRLEDENIQVICVAGNHDAKTLPRLVDAIDIDNLTLLGRDGKWDSVIVESGQQSIQFCGWSFPSAHYRKNPMGKLPDVSEDADLSVGLLHCDVDTPKSKYAPVSSDDFRRTGFDLWVLGHIHRPHAPVDGDHIFYPGSPQPLDPSENQAHGAEYIEFSPSEGMSKTRESVANLRYLPVDVDVSEARDPTNVDDLIKQRLDELRLESEKDMLDRLVVRIHLNGRTHLHRDLEEWSAGRLDQYRIDGAGLSLSVESTTNATQPDYDLEALSESDDPPGEVAKLLLALENKNYLETHKKLIDKVTENLGRAYRANAFRPLREVSSEGAEDRAPDTEDAAVYLRKAGFKLLDELMQQKRAD